MARKQNQPAFGQDIPAAPDSIPMNTNAMQRQTQDAEQGKIKRDITRDSVVPDRSNNPYKPGASAWDGEHEQMLGF
jgi:hypothetical protein